MAYNPPIGSIYHLYTPYILPSRGLHNPYHLLPEPEKSIDQDSSNDGQVSFEEFCDTLGWQSKKSETAEIS